MDKQFHPILYNGCDYISMLGLKLIHVSKMGHRWQESECARKFFFFCDTSLGDSKQCIDMPRALLLVLHDDIIKWKHFLPFVWGMHWSPYNSPHKSQSPIALMFSLICDWGKGWVNNREAGDLRCHHAYYDVTVMDMITALIECMYSITHIYQGYFTGTGR